MIAQAQTKERTHNVLPILHDIRMEHITAMRDMLKRHSQDWANDLVDVMYPEGDIEISTPDRRQKSIRRIYNVCYGRVKLDEYRVQFLVAGRKLLKIYSDRRREASEIAAALVTA